jgi:uncharacterized protein involved in type VI secretion and phage assembly
MSIDQCLYAFNLLVEVAVDQVTDVGQLSRLTGVITSASQGQSDGALTVYKLNA